MIRSKKLSRFRSVNHAFFNKKGGVSKGIYESLNCGPGSKDQTRYIRKNLSIVKNNIGCKEHNLVLLNQIHSNKIFRLSKRSKKKLFGDGAITDKSGLALGILTADCAPVLMYDKKLNVIGAAHAGWKGAFKGIILNLVFQFKKYGSENKDLVAIIGPCIQIDNYEVKNDFFKKFVTKKIINKKFFRFIDKKIYFNLPKYLKYQLYSAGVKNVELIKIDTYIKKNNFFSSRLTRKNKINDYGRNISVIMIK